MIEQLSTAVKFVAFYTEDGLGKTGLTVTVDVRGADGTEIVTAGSAAEIGDGFYGYTLAGGSTGAEGVYLAVFKTATDTVDQRHLPSLWCIGVAGVERLDAAVSSRNATTPPTAAAVADAVWDEAIGGHGTAGTTGQALGAAGAASDPLLNPVPGAYASGTAGNALGRIGTGAIATVAPVTVDGTRLTLVRGDDYKAEDGRAVDWTDAQAAWPDLAGDVEFVCGTLTTPGSIVTATGAGKTVRVEFPSALTAQLATMHKAFSVRLTQADDDVITLVQGMVIGT